MTHDTWQGLFDDYCREHTVRVLRERAGVAEGNYESADAETLELLLVAPLYAWMDHFGKDLRRLTEIVAADELIECATLDIGYGFRYRQHIPAEHIDKLDRLWTEFQRLAALAVVADENKKRTVAAKRNAKNATGRHKPNASGVAIRVFKEEFTYENGRSHGWIAAAANHFKVHRNTIKAHVNDE